MQFDRVFVKFNANNENGVLTFGMEIDVFRVSNRIYPPMTPINQDENRMCVGKYATSILPSSRLKVTKTIIYLQRICHWSFILVI